MIDFIIFLLKVSMDYIIVFMGWSTVKSINSFTEKIIFCNVCYTFFSILVALFFYYLATGIELLSLAYLTGASMTGGAYKLFLQTDRLRKRKMKIEDSDKSYNSYSREIFYQTRFFIFELSLFIIGLIFLNIFKLWNF